MGSLTGASSMVLWSKRTFQLEDIFAHPPHPTQGMSVNVWGHFGLASGEGIAFGILWVEGRDAAKHPTVQRTAPVLVS